MLRFRAVAVACWVMAVGAVCVQGQDSDIKSIVRKAIEAHGGAKNLEKYQAGSSKFKGTIEILNMARDITGESTFQKPDLFKNTMALSIDGMMIDIVTVYNGKSLWIATNGKTMEIKDDKILDEVRQSLLTEGAGGLVDFLKPPYELASAGEAKVKDRDAVGVRVTKKGQRDITLYFDKTTHLLLKTEMRAYDAMSGQEVTQEKFTIGYKDRDGVKTPSRLVIHKDGKLFMDIEITETKMYEKLDAGNFAMP